MLLYGDIHPPFLLLETSCVSDSILRLHPTFLFEGRFDSVVSRRRNFDLLLYANVPFLLLPLIQFVSIPVKINVVMGL